MPEDRPAVKNGEPGPSGLPRGLAQPAIRALNAAGIFSLEQVAAVRRSKLARLHGMGPKALALLEEALRARGLAFAAEDDPA